MNGIDYSSTYKSKLIIDFVKEVLIDPYSMKSRIGDIQDLAGVIYIDKSNTNQTWTLNSKCWNEMAADHLYDVKYLSKLLEHSLVDTTLNISAHWIVVDCTFDGRMLPDTSCVKAHLIDKSFNNFYTVVMQTLSVAQITRNLRFNGAIAIMGNLSLTSSTVVSDTIVTSEKNAYYFASVGFDFQELENYFAVELEDYEPPDGVWYGRVKQTGEELTFVGTTGIFRTSPNTQGVYYIYNWILSANPVEYIADIFYLDRYVMKDIWGWFRCFLGLGIGTNIAMNYIIALLIMINVWRKYSILWIPDIYPAIQKRAALRAILLLLDCLVNSWWYPMMYAMNQGSYRRKIVSQTFMSEIPRADGLMICLGICYYLACIFHIRIRLYVVVVIYCLCFYMRITIVENYGLFIDYANAEIDARYLENIVPCDGGIDLWAYHEDKRVDFMLLSNELTWLLWAIGASIGFVVLVKASSCHVHIKCHKVSDTIQLREADTRIHWSKRSRLYNDLIAADVDNTRTERSVGKVVGSICGFVASTHSYVFDARPMVSRLLVSMPGVWLLGFIIVDNRYLVHINDYVFLLLNCCFKKTFFRVHGYLLKSNQIAMDGVRIYHYDIPFHQLLNVSLENLN